MADLFMRIETGKETGISGGSLDKECPNWIEINSYSGVLTAGVAISGVGNSMKSRPTIHDIAISKAFDMATGAIFAASLIADPLTKVTLRQYSKSGMNSGDAETKDGNVLIEEVEMGDVFISSYSLQASGSSGYESLMLTPMRIVHKRQRINPMTQSSEGVSTSGFDRQTGELITDVDAADPNNSEEPTEAEGLEAQG